MFSLLFGAFCAFVGIWLCCFRIGWYLHKMLVGAVTGGLAAIILITSSNNMVTKTPYGNYFNGNIADSAAGSIMMLVGIWVITGFLRALRSTT